MKSCEMGCIKYILFIFNLIFAISGMGIIIAGALVLADVGDFHHFVDKEMLAPPIVLIVAGAIVFIIAFLGCFGAIRESYNLLIAFSVCLVIIFIMELAVGIAGAVYKNDFKDALKTTLKKSVEKYWTDDMEKITWDKVHVKMMCCGVDGPDDYQGRQPFTCCHLKDELNKGSLSSYCLSQGQGKFLFESGCYDKLRMKINGNAQVLIGVGIGIAFIEIVGIVLACWLAHTIKKEEGNDEEK